MENGISIKSKKIKYINTQISKISNSIRLN